MVFQEGLTEISSRDSDSRSKNAVRSRYTLLAETDLASRDGRSSFFHSPAGMSYGNTFRSAKSRLITVSESKQQPPATDSADDGCVYRLISLLRRRRGDFSTKNREVLVAEINCSRWTCKQLLISIAKSKFHGDEHFLRSLILRFTIKISNLLFSHLKDNLRTTSCLLTFIFPIYFVSLYDLGFIKYFIRMYEFKANESYTRSES